MKPPVPLNPRFPTRVRLYLDRPNGIAPILMECPPSAPETVGATYIREVVVREFLKTLDNAMADSMIEWVNAKELLVAVMEEETT